MDRINRVYSQVSAYLSSPSLLGYSPLSQDPDAPTRLRHNDYGTNTDGLQVLPPDATKIEPKVWLASERTFLNYLRVALLLSSFALALFNSAPKKDSIATWMGFSYAVIAIGMVGYAFYMMQLRRKRIIERFAGHHDDVYGPVFICVCLFAAVLVNFILRVNQRETMRNKPSPKNPWITTVELVAQSVGYELDL
ncbi:vacuolar transporter chaperone 2 [Pseudohyphozyma bogoriensis]|nr:vacuolar transporter chaperone 2 [Pseudohyphozyma bogoriensis]